MNSSELLELAANARERAYAPYSQFQVGAAIRTEEGDVFTGCNVENISFGLTMCAERVAVGAAVAAGRKRLVELALVSASTAPVVPCGACRQVLAEFTPQLAIVSRTSDGATAHFRLDELLPVPRQGILD